MSRLLDIPKSKNRTITTSCMQHICQLVTINSSFTILWMTPSGHTILFLNSTKESFLQTFPEIKNTLVMVGNPMLTHGGIGNSTSKKTLTTCSWWINHRRILKWRVWLRMKKIGMNLLSCLRLNTLSSDPFIVTYNVSVLYIQEYLSRQSYCIFRMSTRIGAPQSERTRPPSSEINH